MKTKRTPKKILRDAKGHFAHEDTCEGIYKDGSVTGSGIGLSAGSV